MIPDATAQALMVVRWLCHDTDTTPQDVLKTRSKQSAVVETRDTAAYLLHDAGGHTYSEIAACFAAYGSKSAALAAARRAAVDDRLVREARRVLWSMT